MMLSEGLARGLLCKPRDPKGTSHNAALCDVLPRATRFGVGGGFDVRQGSEITYAC